MLTRVLFFAAETVEPLPEHLAGREASKLFGLSVRDILLLVGVGVLIASVLFVWAYLTRRERRRHLSRSSYNVAHSENQHQAESRGERARVRKRRRRDHPDNLPRN